MLSSPKKFEVIKYGDLDRLIVFRFKKSWWRKFNDNFAYKVEILPYKFNYGKYDSFDPWDIVAVEL